MHARRPFKEYRYKLEAAAGEDVYVSVSGVPIFGGNGEFRGYRGTGKNITAEVLAQKEAAQAKQRLSDAIESLSEGFSLRDAEDRFVLRNRRSKWKSMEVLDPGLLGL